MQTDALHGHGYSAGTAQVREAGPVTRGLQRRAAGGHVVGRKCHRHVLESVPLKKTILEIYALSVCFITVVCFVVALGLMSYGVIGISSPEFTMSSWAHTQHQTNDAFWNGSPGAPFRGPGEQLRERPSDADLTKQREQSYVRAVANERRDSAQSVVKAMIVIVIDLVVFLFHWLIARRARTNTA